MKARWKIVGLGAACAACCAPLFLPLFASFGVVGVGAAGVGTSVLGVRWDEALCLALIAAAIVAGVYWAVRHRRRQRSTTASACCEGDSGESGKVCQVEGACTQRVNGVRA